MDGTEQTGWVTPLDGESDAVPMESVTTRNWRTPLLGGLIIAIVVVAAVAAAVVWRGRNGDPLGSARSIPADADFVISFDALALSDGSRLEAFADAFTGPAADAGLIEERPGSLIGAIDESLARETGFTLTDDVMPWVGRSVSIAINVSELPDPTSSFSTPPISGMISADVRDREAAAAFVSKVVNKLQDQGKAMVRTTIGGYEGYEMAGSGIDPAVVIVLTDESLVAGTKDMIVAGIDAREQGGSLADSTDYVDTMRRLPADQMVTFFMSTAFLQDSQGAGLFGRGFRSAAPNGIEVGTIAGSLGIVDEGLRLDYVAIGASASAGATVAEFGPDARVVAALPENTLGFMSSGAGSSPGEQAWMQGSEYDLLMGQLQDKIGIDVRPLIESLSGSFSIALTETRDGMIASETNIPLGVVGAVGLTDDGPLVAIIDRLTGELDSMGLSMTTNGSVTAISSDGRQVVSYAIDGGLFVIGSDDELVGSIVDGSNGGVAETALYRELDRLVVGSGLVGYLDIPRLLDLIPMTSDEAVVFRPVRGLGVGAEVEGNVTRIDMLILVDY